ncbi:cholinesterase-like [Podarcis raffonei]|uniref:cholinesterase-like n=1 Tax=Podarcis raffonei TaxID=65483 RepID=UPI0023294156|nr:cholinesterase-like [Podarcis raffonei]
MPRFWTSPSSLCLLLFLLASSSASENDTVVVTSSGPIRGKRLPAGPGSVTAYLGIPYAEPPIGKLRFQKPVPHQPWSQVLEATTFGNSCHQAIIDFLPNSTILFPNTPLSEDCLFLNIWVPNPQPVKPVPVLLWIYGGGFISGTASLDIYNGAFLAATENVIVASMNYRVGSLGFLYLPPDVPGNAGLWDQHLALKWVSENAAVFGGDAAQITLFGVSAGGSSVGFHLFSPASQPLFARAVLQSGVPNAPWGWRNPEDALRVSVNVSQLMGCPTANHSAMVSCLQGKEGKAYSDLGPMFSLTTDGEFIPDDPQKLLETGDIQGKPILAGVSADEGSHMVLMLFPSIIGNDSILTREQLYEGVNQTVKNGTKQNAVNAAILKYVQESHGPEQYQMALSQLLGDYFFVCPLAEFAAKVGGAESPVYVYYFDHRFPTWPKWAGTPHGAELPYLFGIMASESQTNQSEVAAEDAELSRRVMRYWADFARSGNPTGSEGSEVKWPVYNSTEQNFFHIGGKAAQPKRRSPASHCDFLASLFSNAREAAFSEVSEEGSTSPILEKGPKNETQDNGNHTLGTGYR